MERSFHNLSVWRGASVTFLYCGEVLPSLFSGVRSFHNTALGSVRHSIRPYLVLVET